MSRRFGKLFGGRTGRGGIGAPERIDPSLPDVDGVTIPDDENTLGEHMNSDNNADAKPEMDPAGDPSAEQVDELGADATDSIDQAGEFADSEDEQGGEGDPRDERILELEDQMLRAKAEIQNMQRRSREELSKARKYGAENLAVAMLDVHDNLERAVASADGNADADAVVEGVKLTLKQLDDAFAKHNISEVVSDVGTKLDPSVHSAMSTQPTNDVPPNHVAAVIQKGYTLHDRLLRPAMVMAAAPLPDESAPQADASGAEGVEGDGPSEA